MLNRVILLKHPPPAADKARYAGRKVRFGCCLFTVLLVLLCVSALVVWGTVVHRRVLSGGSTSFSGLVNSFAINGLSP